MENENNLNFVKQILSSERFQSSSEQEQQNVIAQIQANGIPLETIQQIQDELEEREEEENEGEELNQEEEEPEQSLDVANAARYLQNLPYDVFVDVIRRGKIGKKDLISFCLSTPKFNEYCNRDLVLPNGQVLTKYLFRQLLADAGVEIQSNEDPREVYIQYSKYKPFSTAALLELVAQIIQNIIYVENHQGGRINLSPLIINQFPGLILPQTVTTGILKSLIHAGWISKGVGQHPFSPLTAEGRQLENFRDKLLQYIIDNFTWLADQQKWPLRRRPVIPNQYVPDNGFSHDKIFAGTGFRLSKDHQNRTFQERINAISLLLTITHRVPY